MEVAGEQDEVDWVVVGIGINVNTEYSELPVALRRTATSLKMVNGEPVDRSELLATPAALTRDALRRGSRQRLRARAQPLPQARLPAPQERQRRDARGTVAGSRRRHRRSRRPARGAPAPPGAALPLRRRDAPPLSLICDVGSRPGGCRPRTLTAARGPLHCHPPATARKVDNCPALTTRELTYVALFAALIARGRLRRRSPSARCPSPCRCSSFFWPACCWDHDWRALSVARVPGLSGSSPRSTRAGRPGSACCSARRAVSCGASCCAALLTGAIATSGRRSLARFVAAGLAGLVPIYTLGTVWLALATAHSGSAQRLPLGVLPFVWVDVLKAMAAGFAARGAWSACRWVFLCLSETADVRQRAPAQAQVDAAALVLAHEVGRAAVAVGQILVAKHARQRLDVLRVQRDAGQRRAAP